MNGRHFIFVNFFKILFHIHVNNLHNMKLIIFFFFFFFSSRMMMPGLVRCVSIYNQKRDGVRALLCVMYGIFLGHFFFVHTARMALAYVCYMYIVYICCLVSVLCFQLTLTLSFFYLQFTLHIDIQYSKSSLTRKDWKKTEKIQFTVKVANLYTSCCQPKLKIFEVETLYLWGTFLQICAQTEIN